MSLNILHRREQLTLTAIDIIDELGIQKLTTREIAKRQNISEATLFRHFKNKNELLISVLDYFVQYDEDILQSTKLHKLSPTKALIYLITTYAEYYENYPAIASILQIFDVLRYEEELTDIIKGIQAKRTAAIYQLIEEARRAGELRDEVDSNAVAYMISGFFREICFNWRISDYGFSLRGRLLSTLELLLKALHN